MKDFKKHITDFHYGKSSLLLNFIFFIPSVFYSIIIKFKNFLYEKKILKEEKINAKVICVGNLTTGGVGKTPVVIELANYLSDKGKKVCVLSRGYGGKLGKKEPSVIKNYNEILIDDADLTGDEVNLISHRVKNSSVIVSSNRLKGAKYAYEKLNSDIIIMDDGFSNRTLYKDLNILLFDIKKLTGNGFCLPMGPLREPVSEMKRAQKILFIDKNGEKSENFDKFRAKINLPYSICEMETGEFYNIKTGELLQDKKNITAFSGIGSPEQFYKKLNSFNLKKTISYNDHYKYSQQDVDEINKIANENNSDAIITTEKDMVKILKFNNIENIYALKLSPKINPDELLDIM